MALRLSVRAPNASPRFLSIPPPKSMLRPPWIACFSLRNMPAMRPVSIASTASFQFMLLNFSAMKLPMLPSQSSRLVIPGSIISLTSPRMSTNLSQALVTSSMTPARGLSESPSFSIEVATPSAFFGSAPKNISPIAPAISLSSSRGIRRTFLSPSNSPLSAPPFLMASSTATMKSANEARSWTNPPELSPTTPNRSRMTPPSCLKTCQPMSTTANNPANMRRSASSVSGDGFSTSIRSTK